MRSICIIHLQCTMSGRYAIAALLVHCLCCTQTACYCCGTHSSRRSRNHRACNLRRDHLNVVFIGHVDAGKSTIGGQILYLTGGVDERTIQKYER